MSNYLTPHQIQLLLNPIDPTRVRQLQGMSHLEAADIRVHMTRVFGFGRWSEDIISMDLIYEATTTTKNGKPALNVGYKAGCRLTVKAPDGTELATFTEYAVGAHTQPEYMRGDLHDFAMKTAASQALKRCAMNLGDMFGLSLYYKGYLGAVVQGTAMWGPETPKELNVETVPAAPEESNLEEDAQQPPQQPAPQQQAPAAAPEPAAPEPPAQQAQQQVGPDPGMTPAQAEVKDLVARLSPADKAAFRAAWKKAQLPPGYHRLEDNHIQWIHATLDDLTKSTALPTAGDNPGEGQDPEEAYQEELRRQQAQAGSPQRQQEVEQARRHFPNAPAQELEQAFYSQV
jgi:hypothetical protein